MKRISRNNLTKISSSSDKYMRDKSGLPEEHSREMEPNSIPPIDEDAIPMGDSINFEEENLIEDDANVLLEEEEILLENPTPKKEEIDINDPNNIYNRLLGHDVNAPKGRAGGGRPGSTPYSPPQNIVQKKPDANINKDPNAPKPKITIGGLKKPPSSEMNKENIVDSNNLENISPVAVKKEESPIITVKEEESPIGTVNKEKSPPVIMKGKDKSVGTINKEKSPPVTMKEEDKPIPPITMRKENTPVITKKDDNSVVERNKDEKSKLSITITMDEKGPHLNKNMPSEKKIERTDPSGKEQSTNKTNTNQTRNTRNSDSSRTTHQNKSSVPYKNSEQNKSNTDIRNNTSTNITSHGENNPNKSNLQDKNNRTQGRSTPYNNQKNTSKYTPTKKEEQHMTDKPSISQETPTVPSRTSDLQQDNINTLDIYIKRYTDALIESTTIAVNQITEKTRETANILLQGSEVMAQGMGAITQETLELTEMLTKKAEDSSAHILTVSKEATQAINKISQSNADKLLNQSNRLTSEMIAEVKKTSDAMQTTSRQTSEIMTKSTQDVMEHLSLISKNHLENLNKASLNNSSEVIALTKTALEQLHSASKETTDRILSLAEQTATSMQASGHLIPTPVSTGESKSDVDFLSQQIDILQKQILNMQTQISAFSSGTPISVVPQDLHVAAPPSFMDAMIDMSLHTPSYDPILVNQILQDISSVSEIDPENIYYITRDSRKADQISPTAATEIKTILINKYAEKFAGSSKSMDTDSLELIRKTIEDHFKTKASDEQKEELFKQIAAEVLGIGKVQSLMDDRDVTEIMVVDTNRVFCIVKGVQRLTDIVFDDRAEIQNLANSIAGSIGKEINLDNPHCDAKLSNGTRVHMIIPPASANGCTIITMRKPPSATKPIGINKLVEYLAMTVDMVEFLKMCVRGKANIILYGETNSGKTTVTRAMSNFFHPDERVISLEDTQELNLTNFHYIPLEAVKKENASKNIGIHELFVDVLRMSPDRLIVGEVRGAEGGDMIEAFQSGQRGGITTLHAGSPDQVTTRLVIMMSRAKFGISEAVMKQMIHDSIDIMIQCRRLPDGTRKITRVTEVLPIGYAERHGIDPFKDIFKYDQTDLVEDPNGKITQVLGNHHYKGHLSYEKRLRYFEFGVRIPEKFGGLSS